MAGFKHRYIVVKVESKADAPLVSNFKSNLLKNLKLQFGDVVLSLIDVLEIEESYENLGLLIIRCNLSVYKYITYTIVTTGKCNDLNVRFSIVDVGGILKKVKKRVVEKYLKETS